MSSTACDILQEKECFVSNDLHLDILWWPLMMVNWLHIFSFLLSAFSYIGSLFQG